jgi:hypothetical protein
MYRGVDMYLHAFLSSAFDGSEWSASVPAALPSGKTESRYSFNRRMNGPQTKYGSYGKQKNLLSLKGTKP